MGQGEISTLRLFVALVLPDQVREVLVQTCRRLEAPASPVRWVPSDNLHLTLQFLGDVHRVRVPSLEEALQHTVAQVRPFSLHLDTLGGFPNLKRLRVLWVGLGGKLSGLEGLVRQVSEATQQVGIQAEERPFSAHITLGRVRDRARLQDLDPVLRTMNSLRFEPELSWTVQEAWLMRSELKSDGALYTPVKSIPLGK